METCPFCHHAVAPRIVGGQMVCPSCRNTGVRGQRSSRLAVASLVLGVSSFLLGFLTGIAAIVTGVMALARVRRGQADGQGKAIGGIVTGAVGTVVGTTVILAAVVFVLVSNLSETGEPAPHIAFTKNTQAMTLTVVATDADVRWGDLQWSGDCTVTGLNGGGMPPPGRHVAARDRLATDCTRGEVLRITHGPTGATVYDAPF